MSTTPRILALAGSLRRGSWNHRLVQIAAGAAERAGAEVTTIALRDFPLPVFDQDLEAESGAPETARQLASLFREHQGLLVASPEYNGSISAALKNAIDWVSRPAPEPSPPFAGKVAGIMAASPGGLGGVRGLVHVRAILGGLSMLVVPEQATVSAAHAAFADDGRLDDEKKQRSVEHIGEVVTGTLRKLLA